MIVESSSYQGGKGLKTIQLQGVEIKALTDHCEVMKNSAEDHLKSELENWEKVFADYNMVIEKLRSSHKIAEETFVIQFTLDEKEVLLYFLNDYMKRVRSNVPNQSIQQRQQLKLFQDICRKLTLS